MLMWQQLVKYISHVDAQIVHCEAKWGPSGQSAKKVELCIIAYGQPYQLHINHVQQHQVTKVKVKIIV